MKPFSRLREKVPGGRMRGRERSEALLLIFCLGLLEKSNSSSLRSRPHPALRATFSRYAGEGLLFGGWPTTCRQACWPATTSRSWRDRGRATGRARVRAACPGRRLGWRGAVREEIGRASCRDRGCQSVLISVVAVQLKKKKHKN